MSFDRTTQIQRHCDVKSSMLEDPNPFQGLQFRNSNLVHGLVLLLLNMVGFSYIIASLIYKKQNPKKKYFFNHKSIFNVLYSL